MDISSIVNNNTPPPASNPNPNANPTSPTTAQSTLFDAIHSATLDRVRKVLREICTSNSQAFDLACEKLLVPNTASSVSGSDTKRKRDTSTTHQQRYEICVQCNEEYDVLDNPKGACEYHPGETEPDEESDFWADHDEDIHGIIDSDELREQYPEGYVWTCCGKKGDEEGCELDVHVPDLGKRVKVDR